MEISVIKLHNPEGCNLVLGQAHFIKTVEDLHEALIQSSNVIQFGIGFCEASGDCLIRSSGNNEKLIKLAEHNAQLISSGHLFCIFLEEAFPIQILNAVKQVPEVCHIFCATANPVEVIVAQSDQGRGMMGVIDGFSSKGIESEEDKKARHQLIRAIGYKL